MVWSVREGGCNGKQIFRSYYSASRFANKQWKTHKDETKGEPYHCRLCNGWHLTTRWKDLNKRQDNKKPPD